MKSYFQKECSTCGVTRFYEEKNSVLVETQYHECDFKSSRYAFWNLNQSWKNFIEELALAWKLDVVCKWLSEKLKGKK